MDGCDKAATFNVNVESKPRVVVLLNPALMWIAAGGGVLQANSLLDDLLLRKYSS